jgi:HPt (histidine-containing phosphotransfer) domain-containing protein
VSLNEFEATRSDANMFDENLESEVFNVRFFYEFRDLMPIELVKKQLKTFFGEDREAVRIISGAIDSEIRKDVSEEAHALKGICQLLGFMAMAQTLAKIEINAFDSSLDSLNSLLAQFQDDIDRTRQILNSASLLH